MTRIKEVRESIGFTQSYLAKNADLYLANLSRLENGKTKAGPTVRARISSALGVRAEELFDRRGWPLEAEPASMANRALLVEKWKSEGLSFKDSDEEGNYNLVLTSSYGGGCRKQLGPLSVFLNDEEFDLSVKDEEELAEWLMSRKLARARMVVPQ